MPSDPNDYRGALKPIWCPGCGAYAVHNALLKGLARKGVNPKDLVLVAGIGCASRLPGFIKCNRLHTVHGRALPVAMGVKLANPELTVIATGGDGDGIAIGGNHFIHTAKRNPELLYIMLDNSIFGMTKGQPSPTSPYEMVTKASPYGVVERPFDPVTVALACGASFVARGFSGKPKELEDSIWRAINHKGFAFVHVLSPCATFHNTHEYYKARVKKIEGHDEKNRNVALKLALDPERYPIGVYLDVEIETFDDKLRSLRHTTQKNINELLKRYL